MGGKEGDTLRKSERLLYLAAAPYLLPLQEMSELGYKERKRERLIIGENDLQSS